MMSRTVEHGQGNLVYQESGRWAFKMDDDSYELTSGSVIEVKIGGHWIRTSIEHSEMGYYPTTPGVRLCVGLPARFCQ